MRSLIVEEFGAPDVLQLVDGPVPEPGPEDVLVRVAAAGLNWIDVSLRAGRLQHAGLLVPAPRYGMGWDVAGTVEAVGTRVTAVAPGDRVIGLRDVLGRPGTHAEFVALHESAVVDAPDGVDLLTAGGLPLAGVTAIGAVRAASSGRSLLVTGGGGVIGQMCVAVAVHRGLDVVAAGRAGDAKRIEGLGARFADTDDLAVQLRTLGPRGVDAVIDTANLGAAAHEALRGGGTFVALVRPFAPLPLRGTRVVVHESWADTTVLRELVELVEKDVVVPPDVLPHRLGEAAAAHALMEAGGLRSRIVLTPDA
ncbi:NADPH:quinone reductase [Pseudonocardia thermophila]|uniref:NADPH:quinone reductase n=1 Tax=Pseudonocardia thermophila TaxID=1848 RepID=A0A1M6V3E4_PSETH|nr:NADP-dependent oxidoreductase [Pseudonocardia thermophila]SHK75924.1 NADPH:quinone reductase [Pseudonocardia thermophila]